MGIELVYELEAFIIRYHIFRQESLVIVPKRILQRSRDTSVYNGFPLLLCHFAQSDVVAVERNVVHWLFIFLCLFVRTAHLECAAFYAHHSQHCAVDVEVLYGFSLGGKCEFLTVRCAL